MKKLLYMVLLAGMAACSPPSSENDNMRSVSKEMKSRKIRRVTQAQILEQAQMLGDKLAKQASDLLDKNISDTLGSCVPLSKNITDTLLPSFKFTEIKRFALRAHTLARATDATEQQLLDAYRYNDRNHISMSSNLQAVGDTTILYNAPIVLTNSCLRCHGQAGKDVTALQQKFPKDTLTGYAAGQTIGIWSMKLHKPSVVLSVE